MMEPQKFNGLIKLHFLYSHQRTTYVKHFHFQLKHHTKHYIEAPGFMLLFELIIHQAKVIFLLEG
jgi:hypothetical protein